MLKRLLLADLRRGVVVAATLAALVALAAMLTAASTSLIVGTVTATDRLAERAGLPDLVQMHAGDLDPQQVAAWVAGRDDIVAYDVIKTLPAPRHRLWIAGANQADAYHEPAFVTSPQTIDRLLDDAGEPVSPAAGQVVLPIHYRVVGAARVGDVVTVDTGGWRLDLEVAGFHRDAQMNAAMVPSKRLVVNQADFAALDAHIDEAEYLVELDLVATARPGAVADAYKAAGLPATGLTIDASMLSLMNAVSTLLIAAVTLVVALVLLVVAGLALRCTVLAALETDLAQIAVLKAVGAPHTGIVRLYLVKYLVLTAAGAGVGYVAALPLAAVLGAPTLVYVGTPPLTWATLLAPVGAVLALCAVVVALTWATVRRVGRISAVEALRSGTSARLRRPAGLGLRLSRSRLLPVHLWLGVREALRASNGLLVAVVALCTFTMTVPVAVANTLDDPRFATYLGSGDADLRIDVRAGAQDLAAVAAAVAADPRITRHATVLRRDYRMQTTEGTWESVLVDVGDHGAFPMSYLAGRAPVAESEIALSHNQAGAVAARVGDTVTVRTTHGDRSLLVTGVYQDITNNGLTAKATFDDGAPALWQLVYADLANPDDEAAVSAELTTALPGVQVTGTSDYASQFFGATGSQVALVALLACLVALGLGFCVTALFAVLVLARERHQVAVQRALGCSAAAVAGQYLTRFAVITVAGLLAGAVLSATVGQGAVGLVLGTRGAPSIQLLPDLWLVALALPAALAATITAAVALALRRIGTATLADAA